MDGKSEAAGSRNDHYILIPKKIIHITNKKGRIPHLIGMQWQNGYVYRRQRCIHDTTFEICSLFGIILIRFYCKCGVRIEKRKIQEYRCNEIPLLWKNRACIFGRYCVN